MAFDWERHLAKWQDAALIDLPTAERIRSFERERAGSRNLRWPTVLALAFGAVLLGAGLLLFVSAHWDSLSPASRFSLVVALVAVFHVAGAFAGGRFEWL